MFIYGPPLLPKIPPLQPLNSHSVPHPSNHKYHTPTLPFFPFSLLPSSPLSKQKLCRFAMLSTLSPSQPFAGNPFSSFDGGLPPWDLPDLSSVLDPFDYPITSSGSDEPEQTLSKRKSPPSDDQSQDPPYSIMEDRKRRRMISNRESARRSRMRKQRHLENLRNQLNRFKMENRDLSNRMQLLLHLTNRVRTENDWLRAERTLLRRKLSTLSQYLVIQQHRPVSSAWPCNTSVTDRLNKPGPYY